jgi:hypothetical protein
MITRERWKSVQNRLERLEAVVETERQTILFLLGRRCITRDVLEKIAEKTGVCLQCFRVPSGAFYEDSLREEIKKRIKKEWGGK